MNNVINLYKSKQSVFSKNDIDNIVTFSSDEALNKFLQRAKKKQTLYNPYKGYWALPNYNFFELACKIKTKAYISCERVLFDEGVIFQFYGNTNSCVADDSRKYKIDGQEFIYYKIKDSILDNPIGIREKNNYRIATPERALCDYIYLNPNAIIDAPENINIIRLKQLLTIYPKKTALYISKLLNVK